MKCGPLHVHIEELVLDGFDATQRHQIADAVERELVRLLDGVELHHGAGTMLQVAGMDAGEFAVGDRNATAIGHQVARAVGNTVTGVLGAPDYFAKGGRIR